MSKWLETDWDRLFRPEMSLPEIAVRGTLVYVGLVLILRLILKRQAGKVSLSDLLVVAIVAGICRNPLVRDAYSITDGMLVVLTVVIWSYSLDWLSYQIPVLHKLLHPKPVLLIRDGAILNDHLAQELITCSQLESKLRAKGLNDPAQVAEAWLEGNGHVSVVPKTPMVANTVLPSANGTTTNQAPRPHQSPRNGQHVSALNGLALPDMLGQMRLWLTDELAWHRARVAEHENEINKILRELADDERPPKN